MATATDLAPPIAGPKLRVVYRATDGRIDLDWPSDRIAEALTVPESTIWVDIENPNGDLAGVEALFRDVFGFHPLAIEDALREVNVPKVDDWDRYLYLVFHAIDFDPDSDELRLHELDIFLGNNYLVTYRTEPLPVVERVRRLVERDSEHRLCRGADHILYRLLDSAVADHLAAIEHLDETIDAAQDEVFSDPTPATLGKLFRIKRSVAHMHRVIAPQREVANRLARDLYPQVDERDRVYFRDVYDQLVRIHDLTDSVRDLAAGALEMFLSVQSNRTNEVMKALTVVTIMFLPMNFLVGFFGMNFFGDTLAFTWPELPKTLLFFLGGVTSLAFPLGIWLVARRRGWV